MFLKAEDCVCLEWLMCHFFLSSASKTLEDVLTILVKSSLELRTRLLKKKEEWINVPKPIEWKNQTNVDFLPDEQVRIRGLF